MIAGGGIHCRRGRRRRRAARTPRRAVSAARLGRPGAVEKYPHYWLALAQVGRFLRRAQGRRLPRRRLHRHGGAPAVSLAARRLGDAAVLPRIVRAYRGGDDHLLSGVARIFEDHGFRILGAHEVAPEILVPEGPLGSLRAVRSATGRYRARRSRCCDAIGPFDIGQAAVVADNHVLAVEAAEGTDAMLARIAELRAQRPHSAPAGSGVLVKAPKPRQDRRFDLPSIGPRTVEGVARAGLAGIAVVAGGAIVAEPARGRAAADKAKIFVVGIGSRRDAMSGRCKLFLVAAEESGDALGGALMGALRAAATGCLVRRRRRPRDGGARASSARSISPICRSSASRRFPAKLPLILRRIRQTADAVIAARPDALVIIDSPDFTHRVARRVRKAAPDIPIVNYAPPSVWAWRPWRARAMRAYVDQVLAILPFEPAAFARLGGPPAPMSAIRWPSGSARCGRTPRRRAAARADPPLAARAAGQPARARSGGLPAIFGDAIAQAAQQARAVRCWCCRRCRISPHRSTAATASWPVRPRIVVEAEEKHAAFRTARAALAASGTVTLELALAQVPTVAAYRIPAWEGAVFRLMAHIDTVILANLVLGENVVPGISARRLHAGPARARALCRCSPIRRSGGASSKPSRGSTRSWTLSGEPPSRRAAQRVLAGIAAPKPPYHRPSASC